MTSKSQAEPPATEEDVEETEPPRRWTTRLRSWVLQGAVLVLVFAAVQAFQRRNLLDEAQPAPAFNLAKLEGGTVSAADLAGKRVLLHFWATWCGVCRQEFGALNAVHENLEPDEVLLTVVQDGDDLNKLRAFVAENNIRYPVAIATPEVIHAFKINAFPTNYVLDKQGRITGRDVGMSTRWGLSTRLGCASR